jgi:hypothetical protein
MKQQGQRRAYSLLLSFFVTFLLPIKSFDRESRPKPSQLRCRSRGPGGTRSTSPILAIIVIGNLWQLLPTTPSINPNCAVTAKGNNFAGAQSSDLFDLPWLTSVR